MVVQIKVNVDRTICSAAKDYFIFLGATQK